MNAILCEGFVFAQAVVWQSFMVHAFEGDSLGAALMLLRLRRRWMNSVLAVVSGWPMENSTRHRNSDYVCVNSNRTRYGTAGAVRWPYLCISATYMVDCVNVAGLHAGSMKEAGHFSEASLW